MFSSISKKSNISLDTSKGKRVKMTKWTMRILGLLNVLFGLTGIWYYIIRLTWHFQKASAVHSTRDWAIFSLLSLCTLSMISLLGYLGIKLIVADKSALRLTAIVFTAEVLYFFADMQVFWQIAPSSMAHLTIGFWELATCLIAPQIFTGYPLFGIIICIVLSRERDRVTHQVLL
jgi:uncharacterized membrane protein